MSPESMPPPLPSTPPAFNPVTPPVMQTETVLLALDNFSQKTGLFSKQNYRMLVTTLRLIFIQQIKNQIDYLHQDPNISLAENPANIAIPLNELQGIEIYHGDFESNSPDTMTVKFQSGKLNFMIPDAYRVSQNLKKVLGNKVK